MGPAEAAAGAGRFAPSPTGPLHLGSLLAAAASYLDARQQGLAWRVRLDDLDQPRNEPGADDAILAALDRHGLHWDGPVTRQSENGEHYAAALDTLAEAGALFYCTCSRKELKGAPIYPGTCRTYREPRPDSAVRVRVDQAVIHFDDLLQGPRHEALAQTCGDFVVRRRDGIVAYQLATAVDDGDRDITRVIRGRDLLENTARQIFLMRQLGASAPCYGHIPLLKNRTGQKLSKQNHAAPLDPGRAEHNLRRVLELLGVEPLPGATPPDCASQLQHALETWTLAAIPRHDATVPQ